MNRIKQVLQALTGYIRSSDNPQQTSLRFMGIITGIAAQFSPIIALIVSKVVTLPAGVSPDQYVASLTQLIEPVALSIACLMWMVGAVRAVMNTSRVVGFLGSYR